MKTNLYVKDKVIMQRFSISRPTLARWMKEENLPFLKIGGRLLFDLNAVEEWEKTKMNNAVVQAA